MRGLALIKSGKLCYRVKLMRACWERDPKQRPAPTEIVEILAGKHDMVKPCLDIPMAAVQIEGSDALEMNIPDTNHHHNHVDGISHGFGLGPFVRSFSMSVPQKLKQQSKHLGYHGTMDNLHLRTLSTGSRDEHEEHTEEDPLRNHVEEPQKLETVRERLDSDYWSVTSNKDRGMNTYV